jgi:hypothetical protein
MTLTGEMMSITIKKHIAGDRRNTNAAAQKKTGDA